MEAGEKKKNNKPNPRDHKSIHIIDHHKPRFFDEATKKIKDCLLSNRHELSNIFLSLFKECKQKHLRETTMYLYIHFRNSFNKNVDSRITADFAFVMEQLVQSLRTFMADKNDDFILEVNGGHASNGSWKNAFMEAVKLDVLKYSDILDQIFQIRDNGTGRKFPTVSQENLAYFYIRKMLYDSKTRNNAIDWILTFDLDFRKFVGLRGEQESPPNEVMIPSDNFINTEASSMVEETSKMLYEIYSSGHLQKFSSCVADFYSNCQKEWLRSAIMYLNYSTYTVFSNSKDYDSSLGIFQIFIGLKTFLEGKSKEFLTETLSVEVSDELWSNSFKVAMLQTRPECYDVLDQLFHIRRPENDKRNKMIYEIIGELITNEATFDIGNEKFHSFGLELEQFKIRDNNDDEIQLADDQLWLPYVQNIFDEIQKLNYDFEKIDYALQLFYISRIDKRREKLDAQFDQLHRETGFKISVQLCPLGLMRRVTMELLLRIDLTNENSSMLIFRICKTFYFAVYKNFNEAIRDINVPDDLWINSWNICIENCFDHALNSSSALELLFRINAPETDDRRLIICESIRKKISKVETFHRAIKWISKFQCTKLKEESFGNVVIYSFLFENGKQTVFNNFPKQKKQYAKTLDALLYQLVNNKLPVFLEKEKKDFAAEKLLVEVCKLANDLEIDMEAENYYAFQEQFMQDKRMKFEYMDRKYFEIHVLENLKDRDDKYKLWFLQSISSDKPYAYCWAKYFGISDNDMPKELKSCIVSGINYQEFINEMSKRHHHLVDHDNVEICKIWGKSYEVHTIITPKAFYKFIDEYLIKCKPEIFGFDCESGKSQEKNKNKATVLQLATLEKLFLIDILQLSKCPEITEEEWIRFFRLLFDPSITLVGFAAHNEYDFLCNKFPFLAKVFDNQQGNVFCLQKLTKHILEDKNIVAQVFCNEIAENSENISLAKFTKGVLNLTLDKYEQCSDWEHRPLTQFQKLYAVIDALIVILLKNRIEESLKKICPENFNEILKNGYIGYGSKN